MTCPAPSGRADPAHHGVDDALDRQVVGDRFETQDDSVPQDPVHERLDVVGDDVVAPVDERPARAALANAMLARGLAPNWT